MSKVTVITKNTEVITLKTGPRGPQGVKGDKGNQWRGAYSGATAYVVDDVVSYLGSSYICILASTNNLPTNITFWSLFAATGTANASNVTSTPAGNISATNVQNAINELDAEKVDKLMATNLVTNGDFSNGTTGWSGGAASISNVGGRVQITPTGQWGGARQAFSLLANNRYYLKTQIDAPLDHYMVMLGIGSSAIFNNVAGVSNLGVVFTAPTTGSVTLNIGTTLTSNFVPFFADLVVLINLTTTFGSGNEPTKEQMDKLLSVYPNSWFNGTSEIGSIGALMRATLGAQVITPTLLNSRTGNAQYVVSNDGLVIFRGTASGGSLNTNIFVLPENIRPIATRTFPISANNAFGVITVATNGEVRQTVGALTNVFLDGIAFKVGV